jgi:carbon monoxide dehydrogenase subunit G
MGGVSVISRDATISATPQAIWDVLADFGALSSWADAVDHSCILNHGPDGVLPGTTRRVQVGRNVFVERIFEAAQPMTLAYDIEGLPRRLRHVANRWTLRPAGAATVVTVTSTVDIGTNPLARAAERIVCRVMAKQSESMLAGIAGHLGRTHD